MRLRWAATAAAILAVSASGCSSGSDDGGGADQGGGTPSGAPRAFFGVVPQAQLTPDDVTRMGEGLVGTIRIVVPWQVIAPDGPGQMDFSSFDPVVLEAAEQGIAVLPTLSGTPTWVAQNLNGDEGCTLDCSNYVPRTAAALAAWKKFVSAMVDRYGPDGELWSQNPDVEASPIHDWQIWNEQNSPTFFLPKPDPAAYEKLLEPAAAAIHDRDPDGEVILGGMFATPLKGKPPAFVASDFLRRLYEIPGADDSFDAIAVHPYSAHLSNVRLQVSVMRDEVERAGDDASIWITEVGASSSEGANPLDRGPDGQADLLKGVYDFFLSKREAWNIEGATWFSWRDTAEGQCDWCAKSGLFPVDSLDDPKPAWDAFVGFTGGS